jgi:hypothetical protein
MTCHKISTKHHAGFYTQVFVLEGERGQLYLRRRHYFPSGNFCTDADVKSTGTELMAEVAFLLG